MRPVGLHKMLDGIKRCNDFNSLLVYLTKKLLTHWPHRRTLMISQRLFLIASSTPAFFGS